MPAADRVPAVVVLTSDGHEIRVCGEGLTKSAAVPGIPRLAELFKDAAGDTFCGLSAHGSVSTRYAAGVPAKATWPSHWVPGACNAWEVSAGAPLMTTRRRRHR
jgi:hypothetical protein